MLPCFACSRVFGCMFVMCRYLTVVRRYYGDVIIYLELFCRSSIAVIARLCFSWRHTFFRKPVGIILSELFCLY